MSPQGVPGAAGVSQLSSGLTASPGRALGPRDDARGSWGPAGPRPLSLARGRLRCRRSGRPGPAAPDLNPRGPGGARGGARIWGRGLGGQAAPHE